MDLLATRFMVILAKCSLYRVFRPLLPLMSARSSVMGFRLLIILTNIPSCRQRNCSSLQNQVLFQLDNQGVIGTEQQWAAIQWLTIVDVINSITWILVVLVLEIDVRLQRRNRFHGTIIIVSKRVKIILYSILFGAATYWGFLGDFLDFWDAFMWLLAFFFIEMNILKVLKQALT